MRQKEEKEHLFNLLCSWAVGVQAVSTTGARLLGPPCLLVAAVARYAMVSADKSCLYWLTYGAGGMGGVAIIADQAQTGSSSARGCSQ